MHCLSHCEYTFKGQALKVKWECSFPQQRKGKALLLWACSWEAFAIKDAKKSSDWCCGDSGCYRCFKLECCSKGHGNSSHSLVWTALRLGLSFLSPIAIVSVAQTMLSPSLAVCSIVQLHNQKCAPPPSKSLVLVACVLGDSSVLCVPESASTLTVSIKDAFNGKGVNRKGQKQERC